MLHVAHGAETIRRATLFLIDVGVCFLEENVGLFRIWCEPVEGEARYYGLHHSNAIYVSLSICKCFEEWCYTLLLFSVPPTRQKCTAPPKHYCEREKKNQRASSTLGHLASYFS